MYQRTLSLDTANAVSLDLLLAQLGPNESYVILDNGREVGRLSLLNPDNQGSLFERTTDGSYRHYEGYESRGEGRGSGSSD